MKLKFFFLVLVAAFFVGCDKEEEILDSEYHRCRTECAYHQDYYVEAECYKICRAEYNERMRAELTCVEKAQKYENAKMKK